MKIREALRLKSMKISNVEISRSISCSRTTLIDLFHKCDDSGLDYTKAAQMTDHELDELIYPQMNQSKVQIPDPDFKGFWCKNIDRPIMLKLISTPPFR